MAGKEHVVSMEGIFRIEGGVTSSGVTENAQTYSISIESDLEARIDAVIEAGKNLTPSSPPKIQKFIFLLRDHKDFQKLYEPRAVSLGPIHYGSEKYKLGEKYKLMLTSVFVKGSKEMINDLHKKIGKKIKELKECFEKEVIEGYKDEDLIWLLLVDGCAILQYIDCAANNSFEELKIKPDSLAFTQQDLFLLENQLPYRLLNWLMTWSANECKLRESIDTYINNLATVPPPDDQSAIFSWKWLSSLSWRCSQYAENKKEESLQSKAKRQEDPVHLLDLLRTRLLDNHQRRNNSEKSNEKVQTWQSYRNVQELQAAGIHVERTKKKNSCLRDIYFTTPGCLGYLWLPPISVEDSTRPKFLNLIAYEMCLDFQNDFGITSYISFLDSLIDEANDVKMLRKAGILYNCLGSDQHVAELFNEIGTDLVPNSEIYSYVRLQIQKHYKNQLMTCLAQVYHDHFNSPWTFLAFFGALLALALTVVQTWYAVKSTP
ncbi:UPF0481 protein At3g47200-like [Quercus lobata]|uniref:Uncharacterized protein n=1 Tax=Quercus lobata TaxID=97700 RepID=A0A7N2R7E9_QUELO|nr:UPF0481 protein At3g47200-like [Quercus lobata]